jgi:hypothetical protein
MGLLSARAASNQSDFAGCTSFSASSGVSTKEEQASRPGDVGNIAPVFFRIEDVNMIVPHYSSPSFSL